MNKSLTDMIPMDTLDTDGALRETADRLGVDTRAAFFRKAGLAGGSLLAGGAFMGAVPQLASAARYTKGDRDILNYALTLEYLEAAFYTEAVAKGALTGVTAEFAKLVKSHENTHVKTLRATLGSHAVKKPKFDFQDTTADQTKFQQTAFVLENTGVHAYLGQAARLHSKALLGAAASIVTVEARHASAIALIIQGTVSGKSGITPDGAFDTPKSKKAILKAVAGTHFIQS
jgi:rubrerythrin